jgi:hypothetical protein
MIRRLSYIFLFFGVLASSAASAKPMTPMKCMHWCGTVSIDYSVCRELCIRR